MDESLVEYTTVIYMQDIHGAQAAANFQNARHQRLYDQAKQDNADKPIGLPVMSYDEKQYGEIVYGKGPLFFAAVRKQIGDDNFYKFLQTYYQRYKYQVAMPDDLLKTIQDVSGQDVTPLYDQWVVGK